MKNTAHLNPSNRLRPTVWAVALLLSGAAPAAMADSCVATTTITNTVTDECLLANSETLTVDAGGAVQTGGGFGGGAVWINGTSATIVNNGSISAAEIGVRIQGTGTLTNGGTISGAGGSVGLYVNGGTLTSLVNTGTITTAATNNNVGIYLSGGTIGTLTNTGTISGAGTGVGIWNDSGTITTLSNSQTGLKYKGVAPATYQTKITNTTTFGTLEVVDTAWNFNTINYGIATGSTVAAFTYDNVITQSGSTAFTNTTDKTGTFVSGGTTYSWTLHYDGAAWDLAVVAGAAAPALTYASATTALSNTPAGAAAAVLDANTNISALFTGISTTQQYSDAASQSLPLLTGGSTAAAQTILFGMNQTVQSRIAATSGLSSGDEFSNQNFWIKPFGSYAKQGDLGGVSGFKATTGGVALGVDGSISPQWRVGGAFATAHSKVDGNSAAAPQTLNVDAYQFIGYGTYSLDERTAVSVQMDIGQNNNTASRDIPLASRVAQASYTSQTVHAGVRGSRAYAMNPQTTVVPSIRADYTWIKDSSYTETGAGLLNLAVDGRSTDALVLGADVAVDHKLSTRTSLVASAGLGYDTINKRSSITAAFAGAPGAAFTTNGMAQNPWLAQVGAGVVYKDGRGFEVTGRYDAEQREQFLNQTLSTKLLWAF
nr:autotransporter domain-containing protein [uncultured Rhodoferax sp.]